MTYLANFVCMLASHWEHSVAQPTKTDFCLGLDLLDYESTKIRLYFRKQITISKMEPIKIFYIYLLYFFIFLTEKIQDD